MSKHLPTPWEARCPGSKIDFVSVEPNGIFTEVGKVYLNDYSGKTVAPDRRENAKLVLVACNTHDELHDTLTSVEEAAAAEESLSAPKSWPQLTIFESSLWRKNRLLKSDQASRRSLPAILGMSPRFTKTHHHDKNMRKESTPPYCRLHTTVTIRYQSYDKALRPIKVTGIYKFESFWHPAKTLRQLLRECK